MDNFITDPKYFEKVVDIDYRNWVKEKGYNQQIQYSLVKSKERVWGVKCYKKLWPEEGYIAMTIEGILIIPEIEGEVYVNFLCTVPKCREKAFDEVVAVERNDCFFYEYTPGRNLEAVEELERRHRDRKKEDEKMALSQLHQTNKQNNKGKTNATDLISVPVGTKWSQIEMRVDYYNEKICIKVGNKTKRFSFLEFGLKDDRAIKDGRSKKGNGRITDLLKRLWQCDKSVSKD